MSRTPHFGSTIPIGKEAVSPPSPINQWPTVTKFVLDERVLTGTLSSGTGSLALLIMPKACSFRTERRPGFRADKFMHIELSEREDDSGVMGGT